MVSMGNSMRPMPRAINEIPATQPKSLRVLMIMEST
jgi:hypothetical protein